MISLGEHPIQAALFDLDGTLVHTRIDFALMRAEMRRMASEAGIALQQIPDGEILEMVRAATQQVEPEQATLLRASMWRRLEEIEQAGASDPTIIPGADLLLRSLREQNVKIGVVTRNCRAVSVPLLQRFDLACDILLTRDDVERTKPDPAHLQAALQALDIPASEAVMIGDHWLDIQAGQEADCAATIGVLGSIRAPSWFDRCPPTYIVKDLTGVVALLRHTELAESDPAPAYLQNKRATRIHPLQQPNRKSAS